MLPPQPADTRPGTEGPPPSGQAHAPVTVLRWPAQAEIWASLAAEDAPRLLVLDSDAPPPLGWDDLEDWIRPAAGPAEVTARTARLQDGARRTITAPRPPLPLLDGDGILRSADGHVVVLTPLDTRLVHLLLDRCDHVVRRPDLKATVWPAQTVTDRAIDARISRLRPKLLGVGLQITTIRGIGYMLERTRPSC